jgi:hypothetical protein
LETVTRRLVKTQKVEREREGGGGSERHYISGGDGNIFCLKVPRQCPLVLLIGVSVCDSELKGDYTSESIILTYRNVLFLFNKSNYQSKHLL